MTRLLVPYVRKNANNAQCKETTPLLQLQSNGYGLPKHRYQLDLGGLSTLPAEIREAKVWQQVLLLTVVKVDLISLLLSSSSYKVLDLSL